MQYLAQIFNSATNDVQVQTRVYRGNQLVSQSLQKAADPGREEANGWIIPFSNELPIGGLPPGAYKLELIATERSTSAAATQRISFWIR